MHNDDDIRVVLDAHFDFDRLSEDKKVAVFKMDPGLEQYHKVERSRLKYAVHYPSITAPSHYVKIRRMVKDSPIPGLSIDYEKWELCCDWRALYTCFFGEDKLYHHHLTKFVKEKEAWASDMRQQMERGEIGMMALMMKAVHTFADGSDEAKKVARRARVTRQYKEIGLDIEFEDEDEIAEERAILKGLKDMEFSAGFEEYSDDDGNAEESEEQGGSDEDEAAEEEWEDENEEAEETEDVEVEVLE
jgi:hypothetical protein